MSTSNFEKSLQNMNIITALAFGVFALMGLTLTGLVTDLVSWLETYQYLPVAATLASMMVIFMSSTTRDPSRMNPVEMMFVGGAVAATAAMTLDGVQNWVLNNNPWAGIAVFVYMAAASSLLGR